MKYFSFIVGLALFGAGMVACTAAAKALHGQNPIHRASEWALDKAHEAERNRTIANAIDRRGGDVRSMRPAQAPTPAPTTHKPTPPKGRDVNQKRK